MKIGVRNLVGLLAALCLRIYATPLNSSSVEAAHCCTLLQLAHQNETFLPNSAGYQSSTNSYWSLQARISPSCIVTPSSARDVSQMIKTLVSNSCPFAIRSGGHNPFPDNNIGPSGVTVDLSRLSDISLSRNTTSGGLTASIGPGARWVDVYEFLGRRNVAVPGGRAGDVGVGGLVLGGGNSFFAARYGFVCDNVENFEVVLASGKIVNANDQTNSDLWQVLKGGANNFGIVTRIDLTAFSSGNIWGGVVVYPESTTMAQISAFVNFTDKVANDPYASLIAIWDYNSATNMTVVENSYVYTKPVAKPTIFDQHLAIQPEVPKSNTLRIANLTSLTTELEAAPNIRNLFATLSFANDAHIMKEIYALSQKMLEPHKSTKGLNWINMFQPLPAVISEHSVARGRNILGLDRTEENQVLYLFDLGWFDEADDDKLLSAAATLMDQVAQLTRSKGKENDWIYLNYALAEQDPLGSYGAANVNKMKAASKKYDSEGVFQKLVPGGFKIGNAKPFDQWEYRVGNKVEVVIS